MKVKELMATDVRTCDAGDDLDGVAQLMWEHDCEFVVVLGASQRVAGTITDRDACLAAYTRGLPLTSIRADEAMSSGVVFCSPDDDLEQAVARMRAHQIRRLPVVDSDFLLRGVVSLADVARLAAREHGIALERVSLETVARSLSGNCSLSECPSVTPTPASAVRQESPERMLQITA